VPLAPVVVEVSPPESPPELRRSLLDACGRAVKNGGCVERGTAGSEEATIVAVVTWRGNEHVRLEIVLRDAPQKVEREIDFGPHDAPEERWRTTGLVVGTLASVLSRNELPSVGELPEAPEAPKSETKAVPQPAPESVPQPEPEAKDVLLRPPRTGPGRAPARTRALIQLSALLAPALGGGPMRSGAELGGRLRFPATPIEPSLAVAYSETLSDVDGVGVRMFDAFAGFSVTGALGGPFSAVAHGEGFVRWLEASVGSTASSSPTALPRVLGGARIGLDGLVRLADPLSAFVGAAGVFSAGSTDVTIHHRFIGSLPALSYELRAGVSLAL
jgi:hypothetical protein